MMQPDHRVITMRRHHAFGRIGNQVPRHQTGAATFQPLGQVVADTRGSKRKPQQARRPASLGDQLAQFIRMNVAQVPFQQRNTDPDLRLVKIGLGHPQSIKKRGHPALPAVRQLSAVPIQIGHGRSNGVDR